MLSFFPRQGKANFGDAGVFIEKYVQRARHIEVQIFGDGEGNIVTFVERECSIQRRHQKIVEETPSPYVGVLPAVAWLNHCHADQCFGVQDGLLLDWSADSSRAVA